MAQWVKHLAVTLAAAVAQIQSLAQELPYAMGMAKKIKIKIKNKRILICQLKGYLAFKFFPILTTKFSDSARHYQELI